MVKNKIIKKYNKVLGIEISESNLIAAEIQFVKNNIHITNAFRLDIPVFQDLNQTVNFIRQTLRALNIRTKDCAVGLSMQYFKLFPVPIPKTIPQDEIDSIILQEGNVDPNNDYVTWLPLTNTQRQEPDGVVRFDVLGISLQKSLVEVVKIVSKKAGLNLISLTPSFFGLGSFLNPQVSNNLISTLWISQIRSEFIVWSGQEPIYEHLFLTHQLNDHVFQSVNHIQTQLAGAQLASILTCGPFVKEANLTQLPYNIQAFLLPQGFIDNKNILGQISLTEIIVSLGIALGASNNIPYVVPNLLYPIKLIAKGFQDIFKDISKAQVPKDRTARMPISFGGKTLPPQLLKFLLASIVILIVSMLSNFLIQSQLIPGIQTTLSAYESRILLAQTHLTKVLNFEKTNKVLNVKIDFFSELIDKRKPWSKILREIADMTPKELWIDRLEVRTNNIDVFGRALNIDAIANFSINLNYTAKLLSKAQIIALRKFQEEGIDIIEFQLSVQVKNLAQLAADKNNNTSSKKVTKT